MRNQEQQMPTPAEMAKVNKSRLISDGKLAEKGADTEFDEKGNLTNLSPTEGQVNEIKSERLSEEKENLKKQRHQEAILKIQKQIENRGIKNGDEVEIVYITGKPDRGVFENFSEDTIFCQTGEHYFPKKISVNEDLVEIRLIRQ